MFAIKGLTKRMFATDFQRKVSPSAWFYIQNYNIQLAQVQASGPRGHLTKEDLINFIAKNNLTKVNQL
jgi:pyruvate/2-oxoglutarate dehydrogenase complex dihydrolipoamide acyltransferase (E2) component